MQAQVGLAVLEKVAVSVLSQVAELVPAGWANDTDVRRAVLEGGTEAGRLVPVRRDGTPPSASTAVALFLIPI